MSGYFLVELAMRGGRPHIGGQKDHVYFVGENGERVDMSSAVSRHSVDSAAGDARKLVLEILAFDVEVVEADL